MTAPTVYVVDDDASTRELLAWLMKRQGRAVACFPDAAAFLAAYAPGAPGCLVLDLNLPGMNGLDLQEYLNAHGVRLPVIFLSGRADIPRAVQAVREGAADFIEKPFDYRRVVSRIEECLERDAREREGHARREAIAGRMAQLTHREREVLELVVAGRTNREIGEALAISVKTVEAHRSRIMEKLAVDSLAGLVQVVVAAQAPR